MIKSTNFRWLIGLLLILLTLSAILLLRSQSDQSGVITQQISGEIPVSSPNSQCGDGKIELTNSSEFREQCDNGNNNGVACVAPYGGTCQFCTTSCTLQTVQGPRCGNGTTETQEQCDTGVNNGILCTPAYGGSCSYCNTSCQTATIQAAKCGDGVLQTSDGEQCDKGANNGVACVPNANGSCSYCSATCQNMTL